ncbi:MAG: SDR family oxidoreductase [Actinomycetota bacterium]
MLVLVTGSSGTLGRRVVALLEERGHRVRRGGRPPDPSGAGAVIHCATDPNDPATVDLGLIKHLAGAADPGTHLVYPSIVGVDLIPTPYYQAKVACEKEMVASGLPWTIVRATQYHQLIWHWYTKPSRNPLLRVPAVTRYQVLDPAEHARLLVDRVDNEPLGRAPDVGGPTAYEARQLAQSCLAAIGSRRRILSLNQPGIVGAAFRAGANLTPNRGGGESWTEFVARQMARRPPTSDP